jgi:DNA-binding protein YbaB
MIPLILAESSNFSPEYQKYIDGFFYVSVHFKKLVIENFSFFIFSSSSDSKFVFVIIIHLKQKNMKTTVLCSAVLFLATASFAQTNVHTKATVNGRSEIKSTQVKTDAHASSEANLQSNAIKEAHKPAATEKPSASANDKGKLISGMASDQSDTKVQGNEKGKLISSMASDGKSQSGSLQSDAQGNANAGVHNKGHVKTHVKKIRHSGKKIEASSANTIHAGAAAANAVKVPVSVKTHAGLGVHIK